MSKPIIIAKVEVLKDNIFPKTMAIMATIRLASSPFVYGLYLDKMSIPACK